MTLESTQDILSEKGFYVLQSPLEGLFWGCLTANSSNSYGEFVSFDQNERVFLAEPQHLKTLDIVNEEKVGVSLLDLESQGFYSYKRRFESFQGQSEIKKAVLYDSYVLKETKKVDISIYLGLLKSLLFKQKKVGGYIFGFYNPKSSRALLGLSPEYLYKTDASYVQWTTAVAGSQKKKGFVSWSEKLKREHKLVEVGIENALSGRVSFLKASNLEYGDLVHLGSQGKIEKKTEDLAKKLHPTAAVGTLPKEAYECIELGPEPRGFYGGYGELKSIKKPFAIVTIRGLEWESNALKACIGGGVLHESVLEEEWSELNFKWEQFKRLWSTKE